MATWKNIFGDEKCKCGEKGKYIIPNGSGGVKGFECEKCRNQKEQKLAEKSVLKSD